MHNDRSQHKHIDQTHQSSGSTSRPPEPDLTEAYVHKIGTACYHLRARGETQEADKVAWRVLHRMGILRPEQISSISPEQLALSYQGQAHGPLATIFLQIGSSLVEHGKLGWGFEFTRRALFLFPDRDGLSVLEGLCSKAPLSGGISKLAVLSTTREGFEWYLERRFKMERSEQGEMTARVRDQREALHLLREIHHYLVLSTQECREIPAQHAAKRIALAERAAPCIRCALSAIGLRGSPKDLAEQQEIHVALQPEDFKIGIAHISGILGEGAKLYELLGKTETSAYCASLAHSFAEA